MDRFTVVWSRDVQDDFIDLWLNSDSGQRHRLRDIANTVDRELAVSPEAKGGPLPSEPGLRVWELSGFSPRAWAVFEVQSDDRMVRVLRIRLAVE